LPKEVLWDYMFVGDRFEIKEIETEVEWWLSIWRL
jgi:hypothetical protein